MKKVLLVAIFFFFLLAPCDAYGNTAVPSAKLAPATMRVNSEYRRTIVLRDFLLQYDSPLAPHANTFITEADKNGLDWKLVAAIAGVESYFGQQIPPYSYNGWGYGVYGNNVRRFASWDEGIGTVSGALRKDYIDTWGATNVYEIGDIYAADPRWANKVTHFMTQLEMYEKNYAKQSISISI